MQKTEITVLMPVYNGADYIRTAIDSVLDQTFTRFELLIIDDGSEDNSAVIIQSYEDPRIKFKSNGTNIGLVNTLNRGIDQAAGRFIARMDQDDICHPERLERQFIFAKNNPEVSLVGTSCKEIDENGNEIVTHHYPSSHKQLLKNLLRLQAFFPHSSAFFDKKKVQELGGYNIYFDGAEDYDLWLRIARVGLIGCLADPLIHLRKHSASMTAKNMTLSKSLQIGAGVCRLMRNAGYPDPSQRDFKDWEKFFAWIARRIDEKGTIQDIISILELRKAYYSSEKGQRSGPLRLFKKFMQLPHKYRLVKLKLCGSNIIYELFSEIRYKRLFGEIVAE